MGAISTRNTNKIPLFLRSKTSTIILEEPNDDIIIGMSDITSYLSTTLRKKVFTNSEFEEDIEDHGSIIKINFWNRFVLSNVEIREFNHILRSLEKSGGLLNPKEAKQMFLALRRLFYCCIRASNAEDKLQSTTKDGMENSEIELSSVVVDSEYKVGTENLT